VLRRTTKKTELKYYISNASREANRCLQGWIGYFRIRTEEDVLLLHRFDAHIRRRLRAIIVRQKKRSRHLYRHLRRCDVSEGAAAQRAYCRRGVWYQSNTRGMTTAYGTLELNDKTVGRWGESWGNFRFS
jgi:RNA-directed DNA polymerase